MLRMLRAGWGPLFTATSWFNAASRLYTRGSLALVTRFLSQLFSRLLLHYFLHFFDDWVASGFPRFTRSLSWELGRTSSWQTCRAERTWTARACRSFTASTFAHLLTFSKVVFPCFILCHTVNAFLEATHQLLKIKSFASVARLNRR